MHLDFTINVQSVINFVLLLIGIWRLEAWGRKLLIEHEILVQDYCDRKGIKLNSLPTRTGGIRGS